MRACLLAALALAVGCSDDPECGDDVQEMGELCYLDGELDVETQVEMPLALRVGRFDGDENPDLMVIGTEATGLVGRLLYGDGKGGLADDRALPLAGCSAYPIAGDVDGDLRDDLLFATCNQGLLVYRAEGDGFAAPVEVAVGVDISQAAIADVDGDGRRDLLVLGIGVDGVPVLSFAQAIAGGAFAPAYLTAQPVAALPGFTPTRMAGARIARDGAFEVVLAEIGRAGGLARTRYAGEAAFAEPTALGTAFPPTGLALRDLDGDDVLDLLTGDPEKTRLAAFLSVDGEFVPGPQTELEDTWTSFVAGHLDGDGWSDLAVVREDARVELWRGAGDGAFTRGAELDFSAPVVELALLDLNDDGRDDLVAGTFADEVTLTLVYSGP